MHDDPLLLRLLRQYGLEVDKLDSKDKTVFCFANKTQTKPVVLMQNLRRVTRLHLPLDTPNPLKYSL